MRQTFPQDLGGDDQSKLAACIDAYLECGQCCTAFAEACLGEDMVDELSKRMRANSDCADV